MGRMIDAEKLKARIRELGEGGGPLAHKQAVLNVLIDGQPTAYDVNSAVRALAMEAIRQGEPVYEEGHGPDYNIRASHAVEAIKRDLERYHRGQKEICPIRVGRGERHGAVL